MHQYYEMIIAHCLSTQFSLTDATCVLEADLLSVHFGEDPRELCALLGPESDGGHERGDHVVRVSITQYSVIVDHPLEGQRLECSLEPDS